LFLITYKGYETIDNLITNVIGIAGIGVALFPCIVAKGSLAKVGFFQVMPEASDIVHVACAAIFFFLLAMNSIFLFTLTNPKKPMTPYKKKRNFIYVFCGVAMLVLMALLVALRFGLGEADFAKFRIAFIIESLMLFAFGVSWLIKGEFLLKDR
jgi:hypothetical protein